MIEILKTMNIYIRYLYIPVGIALLGVLIYLLINLIHMFPNITVIMNGISGVTSKLENVKASTNTIQKSVERNMPIVAGSIGVLSFLKLYRRALKRRKKNNKKNGIFRSLVDEYNFEQSRIQKSKTVISAAKAVGPIVNTIKSVLK